MSQIHTNPALGFYFQISFESPILTPEPMPFMEVSGIEVERTTELVKEGGRNDFPLQLPNPPQYRPLILRRGLPTVRNTPVMKWIRETIHHDFSTPIKPVNIIVSLLDTANDRGTVLMNWKFIKAYPVRWSISNLHSMKDEVVIEDLEFRYQSFSII